MACNCNKVTDNNTSEPMSISRAMQNNPDDIVEVIYNGATYPHYVPSPTGASKLLGLKHYGLHKRGDKLRIHKKELPSILFTQVIEEIPEISLELNKSEVPQLSDYLKDIEQNLIDRVNDDNSVEKIEKSKRSFKKKN